MSPQERLVTGVIGLALLGVYSWIMVSTSGASSWAWLILVAALVLLVAVARSAVSSARRTRHDG